MNKQIKGPGGEVKQRITAWLYPSTLEVIDKALPRDGSKTRSEFLGKAAQFYAGYVAGEDTLAFLPPTLVAGIEKTMNRYENRIASILFKQSVELAMMMQVLAAGMEIDSGELRRLRGQCVEDLKRTKGHVSLADVVKNGSMLEREAR